jgi:hypothetical protein
VTRRYPRPVPRSIVRLPRLLVALAILCGVAIGAIGVGSVASAGAATSRDPGPFRGLGAWVDAFDYAPAFQSANGVVTVTPDAVPDMAALGVKTLYLQAAMNDDRAPGMIVDTDLVGEFLRRAHRAGMEVVAWYFPVLSDPAADLAHVKAMADFRVRGQRFDALALDIESIKSVPDVAQRNDNVVELAAQTRKLVGEQPIGAIVYPAVQAEVINPALWPKFPYKRLAKSVDVWMPMAYWTFRDGTYRDPYIYTTESIARLRDDLGDKHALVHPIGGIGDLATAEDYDAFLQAVYETKSVGWSVYDYNTTVSSAWPRLRTGGVPTTTTTTTTTTVPAPPTTAASRR